MDKRQREGVRVVKRTVQVSLLGQTFTIKTDMDAAHMDRVARLINAKVDEIRLRTNIVQTNTLLVMAAMAIADEYIRHIESDRAVRQQLRVKIERISRILHSQGVLTARGPSPSRQV